MFPSNDAVSQYVTSSAYADSTRLALAIVFDGTDDSITYNYAIRVNSTNYNSPDAAARPAVTTTPPTNQQLETYAKDDNNTCTLMGGAPTLGTYENSCTGQYMYNGALTIQRLIDDWIFVDSGAKDLGYFVSNNGVRYAYFPTVEYVQNGFYAQIASKLTHDIYEQFATMHRLA